MADKTGLDVLVELVEQVKLLSKKLDVVDSNVKTLMNRIQIPAKDVIPRPQLKPKAEAVQPKPKAEAIEKPVGVMVSSKVVVMDGTVPLPIPDLKVRVFDDADRVVKETKTNRAGSWMASLKPGRYLVEITGQFKGKDLVPQNKNFTVPQGVKEYEVI
jgi:hypothetical protein